MRIYLILFFGTCVLLQSCSSFHSLEIKCSAPGNYKNVKVSYSSPNKSLELGTISENGSFGYGSFSDHFPDAVTVSWVNDNGEQVSKTKSCKDSYHNNNELKILITGPDDWSYCYNNYNEDGIFLEIVDEKPEIRESRFKYHCLINEAREGNLDKIQQLIGSVADVNYPIKTNRMTPLGASLTDQPSPKHLAVTEYLLAHGEKIGIEMMWAARDGNMDALKLMLDHGGDVNYYRKGGGDYSPLIAAIDRKNKSTVKWLVENGADVNKPIYNNVTPIYSAALGNNVEIVKLLLSKGANPNVSLDGKRCLPIDAAKDNRNNEMLELLKEASKNYPPLPYDIFISGIPVNDLNQTHVLAFGKVSHSLPPEIFKKPRLLAHVETRGITEDFRFEENGETSAVIAITKIRPDYPKDDSLLDKILVRSENMQQIFGKDLVLLRKVSEKNPRIDEEIILNTSYDSFYPYAKGVKNPREKLRNLGISLYFVQNELFIECAMYFEIKKDESKEEFIKRAQEMCLKWQKTVKAENFVKNSQ